MSILLWPGLALLVAALARLRGPSANLLVGAGNILVGLSLESAGRWDGIVNLTVGVLLLWLWWTRGGGRDRAKRAFGAKSAALRAALVRTVRDRTVPVPA